MEFMETQPDLQMLEDQTTIAKAIAQINDLASKKDGKSANQLSRWVSTKEDHANKIQKIIAEYFLTQRIKSSSEKYEALLKGAHSVMVAAMKCKQGTDPKCRRPQILNRKLSGHLRKIINFWIFGFLAFYISFIPGG